MTATNALPTSTTIGQGRDGWEATTAIELGDSRVLTIETSKAYKGGVQTIAKVSTRERGFLTHRLCMALGGGPINKGDYDFREEITAPTGRVTEKAVRTQHAAALVGAAAQVERAIAYYATDSAPVEA